MQTGELERRGRHLEALDDVSFLRALGAWLEFADRDPLARPVLAELRAEYARMLDDHRRNDQHALGAIAAIRGQLAAYTGIELEPHPAVPALDEGTSAAHALIDVLRGELRRLRAAGSANGSGARLDELAGRFEELAAHHGRRHRDFVARLHNSPSGSLRRLDWLADRVRMEPPGDDSAEELTREPDSALQAALASVGRLVHASLSDEPDLTPSEQRQLGHVVDAARIDAARVQERVRRRTRADEIARHHYVRASLGVVMHRARGGCA